MTTLDNLFTPEPVTKQYKLALAKVQSCSAAREVTMGLRLVESDYSLLLG